MSMSGMLGSIRRTASRMPPMTPTGSPAVRTSNAGLLALACKYGTYIVGGAKSRTLLYFASRRTPTISVCPLVSTL